MRGLTRVRAACRLAAAVRPACCTLLQNRLVRGGVAISYTLVQRPPCAHSCPPIVRPRATPASLLRPRATPASIDDRWRWVCASGGQNMCGRSGEAFMAQVGQSRKAHLVWPFGRFMCWQLRRLESGVADWSGSAMDLLHCGQAVAWSNCCGVVKLRVGPVAVCSVVNLLQYGQKLWTGRAAILRRMKRSGLPCVRGFPGSHTTCSSFRSPTCR